MKSRLQLLSTPILAAVLAVASSPARAAPPEPEDDADAIEEAAAEDAFDPMRDDPRAVNARSWRNAGIGLVLVGAVVGGGALAIGLADPCTPEPGNDCRLADRRRASLAVGIPAAVVFAGGWTAFGVGQSRLRRLRVSFTAGRQGGMLFLGGRF